ncbi:hypothetical protein Bpfe_017982 [Biomphalaria pfeifferi]|uniref:Uncharacterized protein n=1 Tax=Biomphalaria pfeifferi TaxID=112525 RepID=A0AAD8F6P1_BIOPF|nr:hypothetical protein Bpfe_017982 [Biomphalaria pfeifferi]
MANVKNISKVGNENMGKQALKESWENRKWENHGKAGSGRIMGKQEVEKNNEIAGSGLNDGKAKSGKK